ncbi:hypothetical protein BU202_01910 [Streptococcus cuniculi]|uniref:Uncharacterized protein n=1 Tax=Streptococcus cuniculi TaxID=1432788 RepID=A0A1Q8E9C7_9STRE|nr:hypothetical protein [Streptococcus cuniculi]OLF48397.1 hypothetical protein BU202_01910 [Streptococcus cuniculi]
MGITDITWEEYETFKEVATPDNLYIREHNGSYYTVFELGIASVRRVFEIQATDFNEYLSGRHSAEDLLFKSQNDAWPPNVSQEEANKIFWRKHIEVLKNNAAAQRHFTRQELEELLPEGSEILSSRDD